MNLNQLRYFQAVCQYKYIVKAADALHVSQPAISSTLKDLEQELGIQLFHRINKRLLLTPQGEMILIKTNKVLSEVDGLLDIANQLKAKQAATIKVGVSTVDASVFSKIYLAAATTFPNVAIESYEQLYWEAHKNLKEHLTDYSLIIMDDTLDSFLDLNVKFITDLELCFCVNKNHLLASKKSVSFDMIKDEPIAEFKQGSYHEKLITQWFQKHGLMPNIIFRSDIMFVVDEFARKSGAGVFGIRDLMESDKEIVVIPLEDPIKIKIGLAWNKEKKEKGLISDFPEFVSNLYQ